MFDKFGWGGGGNDDKTLEQVGRGTIGLAALGGIYLLAKKVEEWTGDPLPDFDEVFARGGGAEAPVVAPVAAADSLWADFLEKAALVAGPATMAAVAGTAGLIYWQLQQAKKYVGVVRIIPHSKTKTSEEDIYDLVDSLWYSRRSKFASLYKSPGYFEFLFHCGPSRKKKGDDDPGEIAIFLKYPIELKEEVFQAIRDCYRNCELVEIPLAAVPYPVTDQGVGGILRYKNRKEKALPFATFEGKDRLGKVLSHMRPGSYLSFSFRRAPKWKLKRMVRKNRKYYAKRYKANPPRAIQSRDASLVERQGKARHQFDTQIVVWSEYLGKTANNLVDNLQRTLNKTNELVLKKTEKCPLPVAPFPLSKILLTGNELATLIKLPDYPKKEQQKNDEAHITERIPARRSGQSLIRMDEMTKGIFAGVLDHPVADRKIFLNEETLNNLMILGTTGSGKTSGILSILRGSHLPKFFDGKYGGFLVYDPKKEFFSTLLTDLRKYKMEYPEKFERVKHKIHVFDIKSLKYTFGLNLLEKMPGQTTDEVVNRVVDIIRNAYESESAWFKKYARLSLKALLADKTMQHTILAVPEFLKEESPLRNRIMSQLENGDPYERALFEDLAAEIKHYGSNKTEPLLDRLTDLKDNEMCRRIFGQKTNSFDFLRWVEEGHIVLINGEGLNESETSILMGYIMQLLDWAARNRRNKLQKYWVILEEAHNLKKLPLLHEEALPKWRSKGIVTCLITQYMDQFHQQLRKSVSSLIDNIFIYRSLGEAAQDILYNVPDARFDLEDLTSLPSRNSAAITYNHHGERITFFMNVDPPYVWNEWGEAVDFSNKEKASIEQEIAWKQALEEMEELMERDCMTVEKAEQAIISYLEEIRSVPQEKVLERQLEKTVSPDELSKKRKKKKVQPIRSVAKSDEKSVEDIFSRLDIEEGE